MLYAELEQCDTHSVCRPLGELDAHTVVAFRGALAQVEHQPLVIIDLSEVPFIDSAGLGALIGAIRRIRANDGDAALACHRPALTHLLHTTGLDQIVRVFDTAEDAAAALTRRTSGGPAPR